MMVKMIDTKIGIYTNNVTGSFEMTEEKATLNLFQGFNYKHTSVETQCIASLQ